MTAPAYSRFEHSFEVATTRQNGRIYLFASESSKDRDDWLTALAHNIANLQDHELEKVNGGEFERGGRVYLRVGATGAYRAMWIHIRDRSLFVHNKVRF